MTTNGIQFSLSNPWSNNSITTAFTFIESVNVSNNTLTMNCPVFWSLQDKLDGFGQIQSYSFKKPFDPEVAYSMTDLYTYLLTLPEFEGGQLV